MAGAAGEGWGAGWWDPADAVCDGSADPVQRIPERMGTGAGEGRLNHVNSLNHLDLFSGIGGFALAAQRAGLQTIGFAETNPHASLILAKHWPEVHNYGDVRNIKNGTIREPVFVLTGGFPCQPFSLAGQRRGSEDDRHLWPEMFRIITIIRPAWVLGENVPGLIDLGLDGVLSDLDTIGYTSQPFVVPACAVGARHRRNRLWIVAHGDSLGCNVSGPENHARRLAETEGKGRMLNTDGSAEVPVWSPITWPSEPTMGRMVDGVSRRMDGIRGLGNSIVPEIAFRFLTMMVECSDRVNHASQDS